MKNYILRLASFVLILTLGSLAQSQVLPASQTDTPKSLTEGLNDLSSQIAKGLAENQKRRIAVVEFVDLKGNVTDLGRHISEKLITKLFQSGKFTVIERQLLNKIMVEQKLSLTGIIDPASAQKLGKLLGVDAIASGSISDLTKTIEVNARLISAETGEVFSAASVEITKDDTVCNLMGACNAIAAPTLRTDTNSTLQNRAVDPKAIASKDIGSLRVVLKSIRRVSISSGGRFFGSGNVNGIRCAFEFINLETQTPIVVAMNAIEAPNDQTMGKYLRSTLVDENGGLWRLPTQDVMGMSIVSVGFKGYVSWYNPAEIGTVLSKRDDLNSDLFLGYRFIQGSTTVMSPGQSLTVIMTFVEDSNQTASGPPAKVFQMATEIVVGIAKTGTKKTYSLHNFTFDQVALAENK